MEDTFIVDGETEQEVKKQMADFLKAIKDHREERHHEETVHIQNGGVTFNGSSTELNMETPGPDFALVINGHSLVCVPLSILCSLVIKFTKATASMIFFFHKWGLNLENLKIIMPFTEIYSRSECFTLQWSIFFAIHVYAIYHDINAKH